MAQLNEALFAVYCCPQPDQVPAEAVLKGCIAILPGQQSPRGDLPAVELDQLQVREVLDDVGIAVDEREDAARLRCPTGCTIALVRDIERDELFDPLRYDEERQVAVTDTAAKALLASKETLEQRVVALEARLNELEVGT